MGYIGDYIHARAENYRKFGIGRSEKRGLNLNNSYQLAKQELLSYIKNSSDFSKDKELEEFLDTSQEVVDLGKNYSDDFVKLITDHFDKHYIDFNKKDFKTLQSEFLVKKVRYSSQNKIRYNAKTISKFRQAIIRLYNQIMQSKGLSNETKERLRNQLINISTQMINASKNLDKSSRLNQYKSIFQQFNDLSLSIAEPTKKEKGDLAELIDLYLLSRASGKAEEESIKMIKKALGGDKSNWTASTGSKLSISFSGDLVDADLLKEKFGKNAWTIEMGEDNKYKILTTVSPTQDTIDIQLKWNNGEDIRASIKNYSGFLANQMGIHLIDKTPLTLLFNLINTDFVNHYLNILALQKNQNNQIGKNVVKKANEIIEKTLLVRGLSGARGTGSNSKQANTFIFNDSDTGKVKVVNIGRILNKILKLKNVDTYISVEGLPMSFNNDWQGNKAINSKEMARQRITKIIAEVHQAKLTLSLSKKALLI